MRSFQRPLFIGCVITAVSMLLLDLPTGDSFPWFKQLAEYALVPGHFAISAIMFGKLYNSSYYFSALLNIAFYAILPLLLSILWRRAKKSEA